MGGIPDPGGNEERSREEAGVQTPISPVPAQEHSSPHRRNGLESDEVPCCVAFSQRHSNVWSEFQ